MNIEKVYLVCFYFIGDILPIFILEIIELNTNRAKYKGTKLLIVYKYDAQDFPQK